MQSSTAIELAFVKVRARGPEMFDAKKLMNHILSRGNAILSGSFSSSLPFFAEYPRKEENGWIMATSTNPIE